MQFFLSVLVFMMVQAVLFGIGTVAIVSTPLVDKAAALMPVMIVATMFLAIPISWYIAVKMRLSNDRALHKWQHMPAYHH
ncbi:MAG TPA: hypothetical protein DCM27_04220 [Rhodospirillaceae bacterium]|nr:hypothetical protein [Rhodospirillaceae bacterium]